MPLIPLSFVVTVLLLVLFALVMRADHESAPTGSSRNKPFLALILLAAFQAFLSGLRWGYDIEATRYLMPLGAALMPSLVYSGISKLVRSDGGSRYARFSMYFIPIIAIVVIIAISMTTWAGAIDFILPMLFIGYAGAILYLMRAGPDVLQRAPFENAVPIHRVFIFAALALVLSALLDLSVSLDIAWTHGEYAPSLVVFGNLLALLILSIPGFIVVQSRTSVEAEDPKPQLAGLEDKQTLDVVAALMTTRSLYRDPDLNLDRLARKALIPARQISAAINRGTGKNVSQYVNEFRVDEACRLLADTDRSVTEIMLEAGFQTKSNFNREFRRVTDMTPVEWRQRQMARNPD
ncbi:helix-turn-helix transcriptional regulator [Martelella alba]|uniref:Helix-turn-helix transcriptional regulator n=1 Tax=Martelella alba TaxID=2590451 RepID=A0A506U3V6_9HYPH|nr:AraC family transcriptional regulator [Martelella alba]TPW29073.1 helix-turn-helix transcriptional regulator [Martelella alba]